MQSINNESRTVLLSKICWISIAILLSSFCIIHLGVQLSFLLEGKFLPFVAPIGFILGIVVGIYFSGLNALTRSQSLWPILIAILIVLLSFLLSALFFDLSWDGQWYHQTAIYKMVEGWNPLFDPLHSFEEHNNLWIRHYAKGTWYTSVAFFKLLGYIEPAKAITWITFFCSFMASLAAALEFRINRFAAVAIAVVISINPVATCSLYSFQVDGILISLFVCYVAAMLSFINRQTSVALFIAGCAMCFAINTKFTGLVYLCFFGAALGLYLLIWQRRLLFRFVFLHAFALVLGVVVMGYNPYITNFIHRGHPFFPLMGTKEHPGFEQKDADEIEKYETPDNLKGQSRFLRLGYGIFGRPGAQPWIEGKNAELMWPFGATIKDMAMYRFMDVRIGGLGPYFSGILLLSLVLGVFILFTSQLPRAALLIGIFTIIATLLVSNHTWWARYSPQLWWLPIIPLLVVFCGSKSRFLLKGSWCLLILLFVNAAIVGGVHLRWEINSTKTLYQQLSTLKKEQTPIEVNFQWFKTPVEERFKTWGIPYKQAKDGELLQGMELMSVVEGYPGCVYYRPLKGAKE